MLEKQDRLKRIEISFTDGKAHPDVHYVYDIVALEDGNEIAKRTHRETKALDEARSLLNSAEKFTYPEDLMQ